MLRTRRVCPQIIPTAPPRTRSVCPQIIPASSKIDMFRGWLLRRYHSVSKTYQRYTIYVWNTIVPVIGLVCSCVPLSFLHSHAYGIRTARRSSCIYYSSPSIFCLYYSRGRIIYTYSHSIDALAARILLPIAPPPPPRLFRVRRS